MPDGSPTKIAVLAGGVAGLATALNIRDRAAERGLDVDVTVFEKAGHPGGNLRTLKKDGWQLEWGPNGFLDNEPATLRLVDRLGLRDELLRSSDATRRRFLVVDGRVQEIPTSPKAFLKSDMLSAGAKLRMAGELFVRTRRNLGLAADDPATDETIYEFGERRLGRAFADVMLDPMVKGVFGGEAHKLSLAASFPRMVELEKDYGGLFKAMIKLMRKRKKEGKDGTDAGPSGVLHSFRDGMAQLVDAMADELNADGNARVVTGADVQSVRQAPDKADGWTVTTSNGAEGPFAAVVEASPAHAAARHLEGLDDTLTADLKQIPFAPMAVIALGFARDKVGHDCDGFGMLVPTQEKMQLLGALWTSSIFPGRAPEGMVLLRCMAGGSGNPAFMEHDDASMTEAVLAELGGLMDITGDPDMVEIIRHDRAIAQYVPGHLARLKEIDRCVAQLPGLFLTGSSYRGISVNSCVKEAESIADKVLNHLAETPGLSPSEAAS